MSKEAMKQWLAALEMVKANADEWQERTGKEIKGWMKPVNDSVTSLRQAIEKAEKQEPVAWWVPKAEQFCLQNPSGERPFAKAWEPLYTTPQQRTWVGLTADELNVISDSMKTWNSFQITDVYFAIEAKLKEKHEN